MTLHFAYGSNMSRPLMRRRCPDAVGCGPAVLDGFRVIINADGFATVVASAGARVPGLVWRISARDRAALNAYEGIDVGLYRAAWLPVRTGGGVRRALVYVARSRRPGRPKPGYHALVMAAAREAGLPDDHLARLARLASGGTAAARARDIGDFG